MSDAAPTSSGDEPRVPCPLCKAPILVGARKCPACRRWLDAAHAKAARRRLWSALALVGVAAVGGIVAAARRRPSPVGEAPPLTRMSAPGTADAAASGEPSPAAIGPTPEPTAADSAGEPAGERGWRTHTIRVDVHPLDAVFSDDGATVFVSGDDAKLRAYDATTGKLTHILPVPAQGDRLKLLHGRYLAVLQRHEAPHIPLVDVSTWDPNPVLLNVGADPADVVAMPDGKTVMSASSKARRVGWYDAASGRSLAELKLPHETVRLFLMHGHGRGFVGALGIANQGDGPSSASLELFDPTEKPFGATRRSVSLGRDPRGGAVTPDGKTLLVADRLSNSAWLFNTEASHRPVSIPVGQAPIGAFILDGKHGVTLDSQARTATVIDLESAKRSNTLMLPGTPGTGATSPDGHWLAVTLGGTTWPPTGSGSVIVAGSPPRVVARIETGDGVGNVAIARDGSRAAIACYAARELTIVER